MLQYTGYNEDDAIENVCGLKEIMLSSQLVFW